MIIGIDVSTWQGKIDWNQVKNSDVKFAILRSSFGSPDPSQVDNQFENNYKGMLAINLMYIKLLQVEKITSKVLDNLME